MTLNPFALSPSTSLRTGLSKGLLTAITLLCLLGACASGSSDAVQAVAPRSEAMPAVDPALAAYEQRHRQAAKAASNEGRLADALWHWDIVLALHPQDEAAQRQRMQVQDRAQAQVQDRMNKAQQAQQQGNTDNAMRLYMEALAAQPTNRAAAEALRDLERQRTRRGQVNANFTMKASTGKTTTATAKSAKSKDAGGADATTNERNEAEHSSLMLIQDEANSPRPRPQAQDRPASAPPGSKPPTPRPPSRPGASVWPPSRRPRAPAAFARASSAADVRLCVEAGSC